MNDTGVIRDASEPATYEWILSIGAMGVMSCAQTEVRSLGEWRDGHYPVLWTRGNQRESAPDEWRHFDEDLPNAPTRGQVRRWLLADSE